jgi:hypothetical protein
MKLFEIMNSTAEYSWNENNSEAIFYIDKDKIHVKFERCNLSSIALRFAAISFNRNGKVTMTGGGQAFKIYSTLASIIKDFRAKQPNVNLVFEASSSDVSRVTFYQKFADLLANKLKMKTKTVVTHYSVVFLLTKTTNQLNKAEEILEDEGFDIDED